MRSFFNSGDIDTCGIKVAWMSCFKLENSYQLKRILKKVKLWCCINFILSAFLSYFNKQKQIYHKKKIKQKQKYISFIQ